MIMPNRNDEIYNFYYNSICINFLQKMDATTLTLTPKYLLEKLWQFCFRFLKLSQYNCLFFVIFGIQDKLLLCPASEYTVRIKSK